MKKYPKPLVVSFSGGKDSTAMLHHLIDNGQEIAAVIRFDGGWEYPELSYHLDLVEKLTKQTIITVRPLLDFNAHFSKITVTANTDHPAENVKKGNTRHIGYGWPNNNRRWCTDIKTRALDQAAKRLFPGAVHAIGIAADETTRTLTNHQTYLRERGKVVYPLIDANITQQVALDSMLDRGYHWSGLYCYFDRLSCWCCPLRPIRDWQKLRRSFPDLWKKLLQMQADCPNHHTYLNHSETAFDLEERFKRETDGTTAAT